MKKIILYLFIIFGITPYCFAANNATDVYLLAQTKSATELNKVENIDVIDADGNTALCSAIKDNNIDAYNLLKKAGANTEHKCVKKIPTKQYQAFTQKLVATNKSWSFLGMGKWAWTAIGAGVVAGGAAAAMGSGGSSGGGSSGTDTHADYYAQLAQYPLFSEPEHCSSIGKMATTPGGDEFRWVCHSCHPGYVLENNICVLRQCSYDTTSCSAGYHQTGNTCQSGETLYVECVINTCSYHTTSCESGYHQTGQTCQEGENEYIECAENTCSGYNYTDASQCPSGYNAGDSCLSGTTMKYACNEEIQCPYNTTECSGGYVETGNTCKSGEILYKECEQIQCDGTNVIWTESGCACNGGYQNYILGIGCVEMVNCGANASWTESGCVCNSGYQNYVPGQGCSLVTLYCGPHATQVGTSCKCDAGYGKNSSGNCVIKGTDVINHNIDNNQYATLYGRKTSGDVSTHYDINITNHSDSDVYGNHVLFSPTNYGHGFHAYYDSDDITIDNFGDGDIYGLYGKIYTPTTSAVVTESQCDRLSVGTGNRQININNTGNGNVYGVYGVVAGTYSILNVDKSNVNITNIGNGDITGIKIENQSSASTFGSNHNIVIDNTGNGNIIAITGDQNVGGNIEIINTGSGDVIGKRYTYDGYIKNNGNITITNNGSGNSYGIYNNYVAHVSNAYGDVAIITIRNKYTGNAYGMFSARNLGGRLINGNFGSTYNSNSYGTINIINYSSGNAFGMRAHTIYGLQDGGRYVSSLSPQQQVQSEINIQNLSNGIVTGTYTNIGSYNTGGEYINGRADNFGVININNIYSGSAVGMFGDADSHIYNSGTINITRNSYIDDDNTVYEPYDVPSGNVIGIYGKSGSTVYNSGTINITTNNIDNAYGIYVESGSTVTNTGTISINGNSCSGNDCDTGNYIVLNGSTLYNSGMVSVPQMNLNSMGGKVVAGLGSQFVIDNELSGDLNISSDIVMDGNQTTYVANNMIDAGDISKLNVRSASAMFNATIADNKHDIVMQMKDFNELTENASLAQFLADNYTKGNGNDLFAALKSLENMSAFNGALAGLTGLNTFTQFAHEDLSAMREISFSMNNKLFENSSRDSFDISDSTGYFSFSNSRNGGSGQYGISSNKITDNLKLGYGMAMANINTGDDNGMHRQNKMWLFYMPATYTNDGYELVVAPKAGFARSEYNRRGYNNMNYEGYIEKRIFGLMNDLRYPLNFGNWTIAPDLAFNAIVYDQSGHEDEQEFSLIIPDDRTVSVETGLGLYTKYEKTLQDGGRFKLNSGLMVYREFGDTYDIKLGMRGMDGTFSLYNNDYEYRGAASIGFDYSTGRLHVYGDAQYFMDNANYANFKGGVNYRF